MISYYKIESIRPAKKPDGNKEMTMQNEMNIGQVVKGIVAGTFIILAFRTIEGEANAQVKPFNTETQKAGRGEFALPLSALRA